MKEKSYKIACILAVVFAIVHFIFSSIMGVLSVNAATSEDTVQSLFENQNILVDLKESTVDGQAFDFTKWNFDENKDTEILSFVEFCYSFYKDKQSDFGLYVYVYNPKGLVYENDSGLNSILMAYAPVFEDNSVEYLPYPLEYLNMSMAAGFEGLFLKYKVVLTDADIQNIFSVMNSTERVYKISEIQLLIKGNHEPTAYNVSNTYTYSGYAKGYGSASAIEDTLICSTRGLTSISPIVHHTFYRADGSNGKNSYTQDTLYSVYFSVPNEMLKIYGELVEIRATWLKTMMQWAFVTGEQDFYDFAMNFRGWDMEHLKVNRSMGSNTDYPPASSGTFSDWSNGIYDGDLSNVDNRRIYARSYEGTGVFDYGKFSNDGSNAGWFSGIYWSGNETDSADSYIVSSEEILSTMKDYHSEYDDRGAYVNAQHSKAGQLFFTNTYWTYTPYNGDFLVVDGKVYPYSKALFDSWDKHVTVADVSSTKEYKITSQYLNKGFWEKLFGGSHVENSNVFDGIKAIQYVGKDDIKATAKATCDHLFFDIGDYEEFKDFYDKANAAGETVILFRFDKGEYSALETILGTTNSDSLVTPNIDVKSTNGRIFKQNVYLGFDIIHLKFEGEKGTTVIPVVMSPITIVENATPALDTTTDLQPDYLKLILFVLALILLIVIISPILPFILHGVVVALQLPFKGIGALFKGGKNTENKNKSSTKKRDK